MAATTLAAALKTVASAGTLLVLVVLLSGGGGGGFASALSSSGCTSVLVSLSPCLDYISSGNGSSSAQAEAPTASCCAQLGKVASSDPRCLCLALSADPASLGLAVNRTRALGLPDACKVKTPPVTDCKKSDAAAPPTAGEPSTPTPASGSTGSKGTTPPSNGAAGALGSTAGFLVTAVLATVLAAAI